MRTANEGKKKSLQEQLQKMLEKKTEFHIHDLSDDLTSEDMDCLFEAFKTSYSLETLVLDKIYPVSIMTPLIEKIKETHRFKTLQVDLPIDENLSQDLVKILKGNYYIHNLHIKHQGASVSFSKVASLIPALSYNNWIKTLSFENFTINLNDISLLAGMVNRSDRLISLDLEQCNLLEVKELKEFLKAIKTKISENRIKAAEENRMNEIFNLLEGMRKNPSEQQKVNLKNAIDQSEVLFFQHKSLKDTDIENLAEVLKTNETVTHLSIKGTKIGTDSLNTLSRMLTENKTIRHLDLCDVGMTSKEFWMLNHYLHDNKSLLTLNLMNNPLGEDLIRNIAYLLAKNNTLEALTLNLNQCTYALRDLQALDRLLKENHIFICPNLPFDTKNTNNTWWNAIASIQTSLERNMLNAEKAYKKAITVTSGEAVGLHLPPAIADIVDEYLELSSEPFRTGVKIGQQKVAAKQRAKEASDRAAIAEQQAKEAAKKASLAETQLEEIAKKANETAIAEKQAREMADAAVKEAKEKAERQAKEAEELAKKQAEQAAKAAEQVDTLKNSATERSLDTQVSNTAAVVDTPLTADTLSDVTAPVVADPKVTSQVKQTEKLEESELEPPRMTTIDSPQVSPSSQKDKLPTVAGLCFIGAVIVTPLLFIFATPVAGGVALVILAAAALTLFLSKQVEKDNTRRSSAIQAEKEPPPQNAPPEGSIKGQRIQSKVELSPGAPEPEDKGSKKGRGVVL